MRPSATAAYPANALKLELLIGAGRWVGRLDVRGGLLDSITASSNGPDLSQYSVCQGHQRVSDPGMRTSPEPGSVSKRVIEIGVQAHAAREPWLLFCDEVHYRWPLARSQRTDAQRAVLLIIPSPIEHGPFIVARHVHSILIGVWRVGELHHVLHRRSSRPVTAPTV